MKHIRNFLILFCLMFLLTSQGLAKNPDYERVDLKAVPERGMPAGGARADSITIYGGPGTLEGKFQTADMQPDRQGWTSEDLTAGQGDDQWRIANFNCANLDPATPDNHAYWCGDYYDPCPENPSDLPGGYGNNMREIMGWEAQVVDPGAGLTVNVTFDINFDMELNYDFVYLQLWRESTENWLYLTEYTGLGTILGESVSFPLAAGDYFNGDTIRLRFLAESDELVSGADCHVPPNDPYSSDGAAQIDNITVTFDQGSGPVQMGPIETCETGDPVNWIPENGSSYVGDFAKVWPSLDEFGTVATNDTPRWAFIDDGEVVPELDGYTNGYDYGPGGFCVNAAGGLAGEGNYIHNMARSPAIAVPAGGFEDVILFYEVYRHQMIENELNPVFYKLEVSSTTDPTGVSGWTDWVNPTGNLYYGGPDNFRWNASIGASLLPNCTFLKVSFGVQQVNFFGPVNLFSSPAPYFDNIAVQLIPVVSPVPAMIAEPVFSPGTTNTVEWTDTSGAGSVAYFAECALDPGFASPVQDSGWITETNFEFSGLAHNQIYYYRVKSRNIDDVEFDWSDSVFSTQDAMAPVSNVDEMPDYSWYFPLPVPYTASDDGTGIEQIQLFYNYEGEAYQSAGVFPYPTTEPWLEFYFPEGEGLYGFYTVARDAAGNVEPIPDTPPDETIIHDLTPADIPTMTAEPEFTPSSINAVFWSDESASGGPVTAVQQATDPDFTSNLINLSTGALTFEFTELVDGQIYYYRAASRDAAGNQSDWSAPVFSTQDASPPVSSADAQPPEQNSLTFDVPYTATDATSGVASVHLMFRQDDGDWTSYGHFTETPIVFTAAGDGVYRFLTVATDSVGNVEEGPAVADAMTTVVTSSSNAPTLVGEPEFTIGVANAVTWSDESGSGAVAYFAECATDAEFTAVVIASNWILEQSFEFATLADGQIYYYRVMSRTEMNNESGWSDAVFSTQDATAPMSNADELPPMQDTLAFDVAYTATDATSGVASVELFFNLDGGAFAPFGTFTESPIAFVASGDGVYGFYTVATDSVGNLEAIPDTPPDASTTVEIISVSGTFTINDGADNTNTLAVQLNSDVTGAEHMRFTNDNTVWPAEWLMFSPEHEWLLTEGPDGVRTVYAQYQDGSEDILELSDTIEYDGSLPGPVTGITAVRGHNQVIVSWNHDLADASGYAIYRGLWYEDSPGISAYPFYGTLSDDVIPTRPMDHHEIMASAEWEHAGGVDAGVLTFTDTWPDSESRGIYYYEVFAMDVAENFSLPAEANDRATNYILGDVALRDGLVNLPDVGVLAQAYGQATYPNRNNPEMDIGPTDNFSASGIPLPDNFINFEDLMILSMNFGYEGGAPSNPVLDTVYLSWVQVESHVYSLCLTQECSGFKGLNLSANLPDQVAVSISEGQLLRQQDATVFLKNIESRGLDVSLSLVGAGVDFVGSGELFRVTLAEQDGPLDDVTIVVRDANNHGMEFQLEQLSDVPVVESFALGKNFPNPFNPMTTIKFSLPDPQLVRLKIYSVDGRLVTTLVDEHYTAGRHSVIWKGRNDRGQVVASGTYFYRINAGSFSETRKMVLTK